MTDTNDYAVPELFADGVLDVGYGAGMVRIDLFSLSALRKDHEGRPAPVVRQRLVMSLQGFLSTLQTLEGMRQRLEQAGVLPPNPDASSPLDPAPVAARPAPRSPNFR
jgi:hypothetical protein